MDTNSKASYLSDAIAEMIFEKKPQTVRQLVIFAKEEFKIPEGEILEVVLNLQNQGRVKLENRRLSPPTGLATFIKTRHARWYWVTAATAIATALIVFAVPGTLFPLNLIRVALGIAFVLWLPGYSLVRALFPIDARIPTKRELDTVEYVALAMGLSLALVPIVGLLLNFTPWGIRLTPAVLSLVALTMVLATTALTREYKSCAR